MKIELPCRLGGFGIRNARNCRRFAYCANLAENYQIIKNSPIMMQRLAFYAEQIRSEIRALEKELNIQIICTVSAMLTHISKQGKTQKLLTQQSYQQIYDYILKHHLTSNNEGIALKAGAKRGASDWLTIVPKNKNLRMTNPIFQQAARLRLYIQEPSAPQTQLCCNNPKEKLTISHAMICKFAVAKEITKRHNAIAQVITKWVKKLGGHAYPEPLQNWYANPKNDDRKGYRPDILIDTVGRVITDVTIVTPIAASHPTIEGAENKNFNKEKDARTSREQMCYPTFIPFGMEAFGGYGTNARNLFQKIVNDLGATYDEKIQFRAEISVTLQTHNALIMAGSYRRAMKKNG